MKRRVELYIEECLYAYGTVYIIAVGQEQTRVIQVGETFRFRLNEDVVASLSLIKEEEEN